MSEPFEVIKEAQASAGELRKTIRNLRGTLPEMELDPLRAQGLAIGTRQWIFIMTREASTYWAKLGTREIPLGVIIHELDKPYLQYVLVALLAQGGTIKLEMRDPDGRLLWTGSARRKGEDLVFSMPITRQGVKAKGMMAGTLTSQGRLVLSDSRLPKPPRKREATLKSDD